MAGLRFPARCSGASFVGWRRTRPTTDSHSKPAAMRRGGRTSPTRGAAPGTVLGSDGAAPARYLRSREALGFLSPTATGLALPTRRARGGPMRPRLRWILLVLAGVASPPAWSAPDCPPGQREVEWTSELGVGAERDLHAAMRNLVEPGGSGAGAPASCEAVLAVRAQGGGLAPDADG